MYLLVTGFYAFLSHLITFYAAVAAYLCGCFNGALFTSRLFFHDDVRTPRQRQRGPDEFLPHLRREVRGARHRLRYAQGGCGGESCGMARRAL